MSDYRLLCSPVNSHDTALDWRGSRQVFLFLCVRVYFSGSSEVSRLCIPQVGSSMPFVTANVAPIVQSWQQPIWIDVDSCVVICRGLER